MQLLLGAYHCLPLLHMSKSYIWLEETKERITYFSIGYMINPNLNINKAFKEKVIKCMKTTFGSITQPHISKRLAKINTIVLTLLMFYETRKNPKKVFKVLSRVIYTIIRKYACIDYLASELKKSEPPVGSGGGLKHK